MSTLRIARIPYLNSVPFYRHLDGAGYDLVDMPPRQLGQLAADGSVDAGILSLCDLHRTAGFESLGPFGIAVEGPAHSVLLFLRGPVAGIADDTVAVTGETSTSFPLLRLLLEQYFGVHPERYERRPDGPLPGDGAALLIGDSALRLAAEGGLVPGLADYSTEVIRLARPTRGDWTHVVDLGTAWWRWQSLPFVFARWAVAAGVAAADRDRLRARVARSLAASLADLRPLAATHCAQAGLDVESARAYLAGFAYEFEAPAIEGQRRFLELLEATDWWTSQLAAAPVEVGS